MAKVEDIILQELRDMKRNLEKYTDKTDARITALEGFKIKAVAYATALSTAILYFGKYAYGLIVLTIK